ncbi:hypothetical protein Tco_1229203 [Tanacetum coccineum]
MVGLVENRKRPYEAEEPRLAEEIAFSVIPRNSLTDAPIILEGTIKGFRVRRIYVDGGSSSEIMYEHCFKSFGANTKSRLRKPSAPLVGFSREIYHPLGLIYLKVTMGEPGRNKTVLLEFAIVKCRSPYNVILGRTKMRSLGAADRGNAQFMKRNAMASAHRADVKDKRAGHIVEPKHSQSRPRKDLMASKGSWEEDTVKEKVEIRDDRPNQPIVINDKLSINCKQRLVEILRKNVGVFAWTLVVSTVVPGFVMERQLKAYPLAEPLIHKKRPLNLNQRRGLKLSEATLQRVMDKVLAKQKGRNVKVYLEEAVIKSKLEQDLMEDVVTPPK